MYVIDRLEGRRIGKTVTWVMKRPRAAFLSPRSQFFPIRTDPKPANNIFIFFFLAVNWLTSGFVYATLPLNRLTRGLQTIRKKSNERTNEQIRYYTKKDV